jgi:hypothetical protein
MKKSRLMELANVAVTEGGGDTSWIKDPQVRSKVDMVIKTLGSLTGPDETVDGETMQFILEAIGMDEQMLKQLKSSSVSFSDVREAPVSVHSMGSGKFQETLSQEIMDAVIKQHGKGGSLYSAHMVPIVMEVLEKYEIR